MLKSCSKAFGLLFIVFLPTPALAQPDTGTQLVILVRHAEKGCKADDPPLSRRGQVRAEALQKALEHTGVKRIVTTELNRTRATAQPLAQKKGLEPVIVKKQGDSNHVKKVVEAVISSRPATVLVVGHSDSVPQIIDELKGPKLPDLPETLYSALYLLIVGASKP